MSTRTRLSLISQREEALGGRAHPPPRRAARKKTRALAYLRVSTLGQEKHGKNLEGQLDEIVAFCQRKGYKLDVRHDRDVYKDIISGARTDRDGYYRLLNRIERGDADVIVAYEVSRFGRNGLDNAWLMVKAKEYGLGLETVTGGRDFTEDPEGEFMFDILSAVAKYERNAIVHRMMRGKRTGHKNGHWVTALPPVGYEARGPRGGRVLHPTDQAPLVREIFTRYASGESALSISNDLRARGEPPPPQSNRREGVPWAASVLGRILDNPVYAGCVVFRGEVAKGAHEALIDAELWEKVRAIRASVRARYPGRPRKDA